MSIIRFCHGLQFVTEGALSIFVSGGIYLHLILLKKLPVSTCGTGSVGLFLLAKIEKKLKIVHLIIHLLFNIGGVINHYPDYL